MRLSTLAFLSILAFLSTLALDALANSLQLAE